MTDAGIFPNGVALGSAFYDRDEECKALIQNIDHNRHTVLIAPRRFGKTSLMRKVLDKKKYPHLWLDMMTLTSKEDIQKSIFEHASDLIVSMGKTEEKIKVLLKKCFSIFKPELSIDLASVVKVSFSTNIRLPEKNLIDVLQGLDMAARLTKSRSVIIFDEFQEIVNVEVGSSLQASIRHAAERATHITYLFSGSKHRALRRLFNGKQNPLYELCDQMAIGLVSEEFYREYIQESAKKKWGYGLNEAILSKIFMYTECYPRYVNELCARIWMNPLNPTPELIKQLWEDFIFSRKNGIREELSSLKMNERKLFKYLCFNKTREPYSRSVLLESDLSQATVQRALETLLDKDLVVDIDGEYNVIDPTYKFYFEMF